MNDATNGRALLLVGVLAALIGTADTAPINHAPAVRLPAAKSEPVTVPVSDAPYQMIEWCAVGVTST